MAAGGEGDARGVRGRVRPHGLLVLLAALMASCSVAASATAADPTLRLRTLRVNDPMSNGIEAFRMLAPVGWVRRGGVVWDLRYASVASVVMQLRNPRAPEALETFQLIPQIWQEAGILGFPEGSIYLGMVVRRPLSAIAMVEGLVVPAFRGGFAPRVTARVAMPHVARALAAGGQGPVTTTQYDAGRVRIAYTANGRAMEEDFYAVSFYSQAPSLPGATMWGPQFLYSFKAPRGQLDGRARLLQTMVSSVRLSLKWYAGYARVFDMWVNGQMQAIRAAGALSKTIAAASDSISRATSEAWENQQRAYDRVYDQVSEQIRGVETYDNPFEGRDVQLPSDYRYAWASASGEYVLSDQAGFNPNVGSTTEWRQLRPAP
jgi:hypothetical protein